MHRRTFDDWKVIIKISKVAAYPLLSFVDKITSTPNIS